MLRTGDVGSVSFTQNKQNYSLLYLTNLKVQQSRTASLQMIIRLTRTNYKPNPKCAYVSVLFKLRDVS
jgi:uncharacterized protein YlbG (UPF0298 family)